VVNVYCLQPWDDFLNFLFIIVFGILKKKKKKGELQLYIYLRITLRTVDYLVPFLLSAQPWSSALLEREYKVT
jgi:hypothetical protein